MKRFIKSLYKNLPFAVSFFILSSYFLPLLNFINFDVYASEYSNTLTMGDTTSESNHNIQGWSSLDISGGYGGCNGGKNCHYRQIIEETGCDENSRTASATFNVGDSIVQELTIKHLNGKTDDSFEVYLNSVETGNKIGNYDWIDNGSNEEWKETSFTLANLSGDFTIILKATGNIWGSCSTYGQGAVQWIKVSGYTKPDAPANLRWKNPTKTCGGYTNSYTITADWDDVTDAVKYEYMVDTPNITGWTTTTTQSELNGAFNQGEGTYTYSVRAQDSNGDWSEWSSECSITYDTTAPSQPQIKTIYKGHDSSTWEEVTCGGYTNDTKISIEWYPNLESDIAGYWFGTKTNPYHQWFDHPNIFKKGNMTPGNNPYYYTVIAVDKAGNESLISEPCGLILDTENPNLTWNNPSEGQTINGNVTLEATCDGGATESQYVNFWWWKESEGQELKVDNDKNNEDDDAFENNQYHYVRRHDPSSGTVTGNTFSWVLDTTDNSLKSPNYDWDGEWRFRAACKDEAGNYSHAEINVTVDNEPPSSNFTTPTSNSSFNNPISISGQTTDDGSGVDFVDISWTTYDDSTSTCIDNWQPLTTFDNTNDDTPFNWPESPYNWTPDNEGKYCLKAEGTDTLGNKEATVVVSNVSYDTSTPEITELSVTPEYLAQDVHKSGTPIGNTVTVTARVTDQSGVKAVSADFSYNDTYTDRPYPQSVGMYDPDGDGYYTVDYNIPADWRSGTLYVKVAARDNTPSGNWGRGFETETLIIDNQQIDILNVSTDKSLYRAGETITFSATIKNVGQVDITDGRIKVGLDKSGIRISGTGQNYYFANYPPIQPGEEKTIEFTQLVSDTWEGNDYWYDIKIYGQKFPISYWYNVINRAVDITIDNTKPTLNIDTPSNDNFISGPFDVTGTASDNLSGIKDIRVRFRNESDNQLIETCWANYDPSTEEWDLTVNDGVACSVPDGIYKIVVRARDNAGNNKFKNVRRVTIDNTPPTIDTIDDQSFNEGEEVDLGILDGLGTYDNFGLSEICYDLDSPEGFSGPSGLTLPSSCEDISILGTGDSISGLSGNLLPIDTSILFEGTYTLNYYVTDLAGNESTHHEVVININNVKPNVILGSNQTINEGDTAVFTSSFVDPSYIEDSPFYDDENDTNDPDSNTPDDAPWTVEIDYGEGDGYQSQPDMAIPGIIRNLSHQYNNSGIYTVTIRVCEGTEDINEDDLNDGEGECGTDIVIITVNSTGDDTNNNATTGGNVEGASNIPSGGVRNALQSVTPNNSEEDDDTEDKSEEIDQEILGEQACENTSVISGYIYYDDNENGVKDTTEEGIHNALVKIYQEVDGEEELITSARTDENGYWDAEICPGDYKIKIDTDTLPEKSEVLGDSSQDVTIIEYENIGDVNFTVKKSKNLLESFNWLWCLAPLLLLVVIIIIYSIFKPRNSKVNTVKMY